MNAGSFTDKMNDTCSTSGNDTGCLGQYQVRLTQSFFSLCLIGILAWKQTIGDAVASLELALYRKGFGNNDI